MTFALKLAKGDIGERIVDDWLIARGYVPYRPAVGAAHPFDRLVASADKTRVFVVEVKSKPHRDNYPDTGIDERHYDDYKRVAVTHNMTVFIAFVDEREKSIYGNTLAELDQSRRIGNFRYPSHFRGIVYFPLVAMRTIAHLTDTQCSSLAALRTSAHTMDAAA